MSWQRELWRSHFNDDVGNSHVTFSNYNNKNKKVSEILFEYANKLYSTTQKIKHRIILFTARSVWNWTNNAPLYTCRITTVDMDAITMIYCHTETLHQKRKLTFLVSNKLNKIKLNVSEWTYLFLFARLEALDHSLRLAPVMIRTCYVLQGSTLHRRIKLPSACQRSLYVPYRPTPWYVQRLGLLLMQMCSF